MPAPSHTRLERQRYASLRGDKLLKFNKNRKNRFTENVVACIVVAMQQANKQRCYATSF
jgi:hypothetical protein